MGRTRTSPYRLRLDGPHTTACWYVRRQGRPTAANLRRYLEAFNASLAPGGSNEHLRVPPSRWARIEENCDGGAVLVEVNL